MKNLAIVSARSGSKGVKDKNIRLLAGKPLMAYSIEAAIRSGKFDEVMVSTDSEKYAAIAREYGANVPFLRSELTSSDTATSWAMVDEVLEMYEERGQKFDTFCLLQPTSPLRKAEDIVKAYEILEEKADFAVVSVCEGEHPTALYGHLPENGEFDNFLPRTKPVRRQDRQKEYRLNGAIYIAYIERYKEDHFLFQKGSYAYIMDQSRSSDIDTELDYQMAEFLMQRGIV